MPSYVKRKKHLVFLWERIDSIMCSGGTIGQELLSGPTGYEVVVCGMKSNSPIGHMLQLIGVVTPYKASFRNKIKTSEKLGLWCLSNFIRALLILGIMSLLFIAKGG